MTARQRGRIDHTARIIAGVPEGLDALVLAQLVNEAQSGATPGTLLHVARDDRRMEQLEQALSFFAPKVRVITFPAWDTVPYDRVGPGSDIVARRMATLAKLALATRKHPTIVLTTVNAIVQRVPARSFMKRTIKAMAPGQRVDMARLTQRLALMGYTRSGTVMEQGEYAVRGGILDLYPPGRSSPVRLDFFGDTLETHQGLRRRDAAHDQAGAEAGADAGERGRVRRGSREAVPHALCRAVRRQHRR